MSTGIGGLDKRDQAAVREWLRLEALARSCDRFEAPIWLWPAAWFALGYLLSHLTK